jgi:serine/threonine-protein kinase
LPYLGKSQRELFTQLLSQPPIPLASARKGIAVDPGVETVVMRGLSRNPADRYSDVLSFAAALREAVANPSARARSGLLDRMKSIMRRNEAT